VVKKIARSDIQRICVSFTNGQAELIQKLVGEGDFGNSKTEVVKEIVLKYLDERRIRI
jgi:Arc/MetJ-type ribon-helix-helix transcriptional regulator